MMTINLYNVNYHFVTYSRKKSFQARILKTDKMKTAS